MGPNTYERFKNTKEAIVFNGTHSAYMRQMLNTSSSKNRITPNDCNQLVSAGLDYGP